ncbi:hypothetical protein CHLNCDRAFT_143120 [Chlorella variabilis]|uniref:Signal peptidase complex subunit 2 n=1 Tax=Chlorella variabilis TaxID=554065 RepID=E1Z9H9_CHLVA|nr:hypothetical protein CHLNCDRAFT_143120 [Chlorella variabilis]EFN57522.1 hypothetical protein CHLNCDRAFT_143120 [Chlorella variabilis]|eukprot:XP_005849624.1 hypothetical protein CHLNCDRAFT_143120 [Chlorella variabilis]
MPKQKQKKEEKDVFKLEEEHHEKKPEKIDLGDTTSLKRALDEAVIEAAGEEGHRIDNIYTDTKIVLGLLACGVACLAQFYPKKYPDNTLLLAGCVVAYVVLSSLMTVVAMVCEKDVIAFTRAAPGGPPALAIASRLPRFQQFYTLCVTPRGARAASRGGGAQSLSRSVGEYFHEDGQLAAGVIKKDAVELLRKATEGKTK